MHQYLPFDLRFLVKRFLKFWNPELTFILETEIWPNLIDLLNRRNKKVFLVNARLSQKSFQGYKKIMPVLGNVFSKLNFTVCQGANDLQRFIELGVDKHKIKKDFSFKFDRFLKNPKQSPKMPKTVPNMSKHRRRCCVSK